MGEMHTAKAMNIRYATVKEAKQEIKRTKSDESKPKTNRVKNE